MQQFNTYVLVLQAEKMTQITWSPDGTLLVSGSQDGSIAIWDVESGELVRTLNGHTKTVTTLAWSPDGTLLASGSQDGCIRIWDVTKGETLMVIVGQKKIQFVSWSPDGTRLCSLTAEKKLQVWRREPVDLSALPLAFESSGSFETRRSKN